MTNYSSHLHHSCRNRVYRRQSARAVALSHRTLKKGDQVVIAVRNETIANRLVAYVGLFLSMDSFVLVQQTLFIGFIHRKQQVFPGKSVYRIRIEFEYFCLRSLTREFGKVQLLSITFDVKKHFTDIVAVNG